MKVVMQYRSVGFFGLEQMIRSCFAHITDKIYIISITENSYSSLNPHFSHQNSQDKEIHVNFDLQPNVELSIAKKAIVEAISLRGNLLFLRFENMPSYTHSSSHLTHEERSDQKNTCS